MAGVMADLSYWLVSAPVLKLKDFDSYTLAPDPGGQEQALIKEAQGVGKGDG